MNTMSELLTEIKEMMYEEMGISDTVTRETKNIISQIIKDSKQYPFSSIKQGNFIYTTIDNYNINIYYKLYYCEDDKHTPISKTTGYSQWDGKIFTLNTTIIYIKSENKYKDYRGTTQHEMDHIYKMIRSRKHLLNKLTSLNLYDIADRFKSSKDLPHKLIGYVIYYNNNFEKDAFINSLYKIIMDNRDIDPYTTIQNSITYENIQVFKDAILNSNEFKNEITEICINELHKSYKWFYNMTKKVVDNYIYKMGRLLVKVNKDINIKRLDDVWPDNLKDNKTN